MGFPPGPFRCNDSDVAGCHIKNQIRSLGSKMTKPNQIWSKVLCKVTRKEKDCEDYLKLLKYDCYTVKLCPLEYCQLMARES